VKINLESARASLTPEEMVRNIALSKGYRRAVAQAKRPPLAVVGGGPSVQDRLDELRVWRGHIWAINKAFGWLRENGVKARFYTADPKPFDSLDIRPGDDVLVGAHSFPELFEQVWPGNVEVYQHGTESGIVPGITSAGTAATVALALGYLDVTFFGCESSFSDVSHAYENEYRPTDMIRVRCNGKDHLTKPEFATQAELLAVFIRMFPRIYKQRGGGLLAAMVSDPDYRVTHASPSLVTQAA